MPTYVYRRPDGTTFEVFQKISADALTQDPDSGVPVSRVISGGAGLQFKGDGFYITDYVKKSGSNDAAEPSNKETKGGESKGEAKTKAKKPESTTSKESKTATPSSGSTSSPKDS